MARCHFNNISVIARSAATKQSQNFLLAGDTMALQINTTWAKIGINTSRAKISIEQPKGELTIKQIKASLNIDREIPRVIIDQYQCFAEAGLKNLEDFTKEYAELGRQGVLEGIGRRATEGNMMAEFEKGNPISKIAEQNAFPIYDYNINFIPKSRPKIEVKGYLNIDVELGKVIVNYKPNKPEIKYKHGNIEFYLRQKGNIKIRYIDEEA